MTLMTKCYMQNRSEYLLTWIPTEYAVPKSTLKIMNDLGDWEYGWEIIFIYNDLPEDEVDKVNDMWIDVNAIQFSDK